MIKSLMARKSSPSLWNVLEKCLHVAPKPKKGPLEPKQVVNELKNTPHQSLKNMTMLSKYGWMKKKTESASNLTKSHSWKINAFDEKIGNRKK